MRIEGIEAIAVAVDIPPTRNFGGSIYAVLTGAGSGFDSRGGREYH